MAQESQTLTYKWLAGIAGAVIFFGFTFWITTVQADISALQEDVTDIAVVKKEVELLRLQSDRIELKLDTALK